MPGMVDIYVVSSPQEWCLGTLPDVSCLQPLLPHTLTTLCAHAHATITPLHLTGSANVYSDKQIQHAVGMPVEYNQYSCHV